MAFKVQLITSAVKDLNNAIEYYSNINPSLSKRFYEEFRALNQILETEPFFEIKYGTVRTLKLKSFPYLVHFTLNEIEKSVIIIAVVFGKQGKTNFKDRL